LRPTGRHLLGRSHDVLDLSKIEAGQLVLELSDYSVQDIAQTVQLTALDSRSKFNATGHRELKFSNA
jgi:hypothetical protein